MNESTPAKTVLAQELEAPNENAAKELKAIMKEHGFVEPNRGDLDDPSLTWRYHKPDYTAANLSYMKGKSKNHPEGSLEQIVENLVKTWEMEASHKIDFRQWTTANHDKFHISVNGGKLFSGVEAIEAGNYNVMLAACPKDLYDAEKETFDTSFSKFRSAFKDGFPWEVLQVFSGPPKVVFSWRHWAKFNGEYKGRKGMGETLEMSGFGVVAVTNMKVDSVEVYFNPVPFMEAMEGRRSASSLKEFGVAYGCPLVDKK